MKRLPLFASLVAGLVLATGVSAADFPSHPVSLVVPYPAGGPNDAMARQIQPALQKALGQTLIIENFGGAGGLIGVNKVLGANNDGHRVLMASPMELIQTPLAQSAAKFQPDDMRLAGLIINTDVILLARKDLPAHNVAELVTLARKADAKRLSYGSVGKGSLYHLVGEYFTKKANVELLHVPYRGGAQVLQDLAGGQIDIAFMPLAGPVLGMVQSGQVKALALAAGKRHPIFPQLPLVSETPGIGEFSVDIWAALAVPKTVTDKNVEKLQTALAEALRQPDVRKDLESTGPRVSAPANNAQLAQHYTQEIARYQAIAQAIGLKPE